MKTLSAFFHQRASWSVFAIVFIVYGLFMGYLLPRAEKSINDTAGKVVGIIDLGMDIDPSTIQQQVADYGPAGRDLYRRTELTMDIVYPITYTLFFTLILTFLMRGLPLSDRIRQANVLPFVMFGFDLLENVCIITLLSTYPEQSNLVATLCVAFRTLKWLTFVVTTVLILYLIGRRLFGRRAVAKTA